jgi:uncharacterized protein YbbC (DUF1343 family)
MITLTGIDVLIRDNFKQIDGQRVGLVTNHTGLTRDGRTTIDVLHHAKNVKLTALFGPEHGIRGTYDEKVKDGNDPQTGLPVYSLYGETQRPKPEQLKGLDALVYDIQDIGCRFYTYTSTLGNCLEEAAKAKLHMVVLDRPNPITGTAVEGPVADADKLTFVAWHPVSVRYGMTIGELGRLFNVERKIGAGLIVVPCEGWKRGRWWDETGLAWTNPSPNMRSLTQATLYPGVGLLETTNVSVGRGTDTPFEVVGAPWMDGQTVAEELNGRGLPGVRFIPVRFTPKSSVHKDAACGGVNVVITNRDRFQCLRTGMEMAVALRKLYPRDWNADPRYNRLLVSDKVLKALLDGTSAAELERLWQPELRAFKQVRARYLMYD